MAVFNIRWNVMEYALPTHDFIKASKECLLPSELINLQKLALRILSHPSVSQKPPYNLTISIMSPFGPSTLT